LILNTDYESAKDVASVLILIDDNPNFDATFWKMMGEKAYSL